MDESKAVQVRREARIVVSPDVIAQRLGSETILVHLNTNVVYSLNRTGAELWELARSGGTRADIETGLLAKFTVDPRELAREVDRLLLALQERDLVRIVDAPAR